MRAARCKMRERMDETEMFLRVRKQIARAVAVAVEKALAAFYDDCDVTLQVRRSRCVRVDIRVIDQITSES